jgi:hypothetical protein
LDGDFQQTGQIHQRQCYVIDSAFIDDKGVMKFIEPEEFRNYEGSYISQ